MLGSYVIRTISSSSRKHGWPTTSYPFWSVCILIFYADGVSAKDTTSGILIGRPFGGIGILWRKSIGACIQVHKYNTGVMGIEFDNGNRKLLAVNNYIYALWQQF